MNFLREVDLSGQGLPSTWAETVKKLKNNYANDAVIRALADLMKYQIIIVTAHRVRNSYKKHKFQNQTPALLIVLNTIS